jgi:LacI family transcriptional regulator/LacI family repressor for deo operon, udp, cdd, tsx, nupC, and nupG
VKKVTIGDVAKRAEVSIGTVSAVLNEKNTVKPETRKIVLSTMKELNYRPHGSARNLKNADAYSDSIGLLVRELDNPFYTAIALSVMEYAKSKGYLVVIASSEGDHTYEEKITHGFSGKDINFPFVLLENVKGIQANVVSIDNIKAMKESMKYLMDNGHSKIIHFAGPNHASHTFERIDGFRRAFSESHFAFSSDMIISTGAHLEDGYKKCLEYFRGRNREDFPTAIVCYNDLVALGVLAALREMKIKIPDDISVVGNDDIPFSRHVPVQLTTIRAPMFELGRKATEILINNIEAHKPLPIENIVLDAEFIVRQSTTSVCSHHTDSLKEYFQTVNQS